MKLQFYPQKSNLNLFIQKLIHGFKFLSILLISFSWLNSNAQTITGVTGQSTVCIGSQASISFTVTNGTGSSNYFTANTTFTIYYRKGTTGSFANLTTFKTTTAPSSSNGASALINYTLNVPPLATVGSYQISIGSTLPTFVGSGGINASPSFSIINNSTTATFTKVFASSCNGGTDGSIDVIPSGGSSPYTYSWTGVGGFAATTQNIAGLALGDYNVVVTDKNLCATSLTGITIKQAPAVQVGLSKTIPTCAGNDGTLNVYRIGGVYDGISPIQYKIDGSATIPYQNSGSFTGLTAGDYIITAKDSKGCTGTALVNLPADIRPAPTVGILQKILPSCGQTNGSISAFRIGGVADATHPIQYKLDGDATISYQNSNVFSGLAAGNYFVTLKDSRGCTGILAVSLPADARPAPTVGLNQSSQPGCTGNDGSISSFRIGGVADGITPIQFKLDGAATVPYQSSGAFNGLSAGNYTVTVKDSRGCTSSSPVVLTQAGPLSFMPNSYNTNVSACGGGSDGAIVVAISGGVAPFHYILDGVEKQVSSLTTGGFGSLQPNISYNVTVTDSKGCSISKNVTLIQEVTPTALVTYTGNVSCIGGNDGFITSWHSGGVPGYNYSKDGGANYQGSYRFLDLSAGTYSIVIKDSKGCISAPLAITILDGSKSCMAGRVGNTSSSNIENRSGISNENTSLLYQSKIPLNFALSAQAYPNPFASEFTLDVKGNAQEKVSIVVTDILGRRISQAKGNANMQYKFGSDLKHGIYIVQVMQGNNIETIKIVKE